MAQFEDDGMMLCKFVDENSNPGVLSGYVHHDWRRAVSALHMVTCVLPFLDHIPRLKVYQTRPRSCWAAMINHPYGASSSYMYANVVSFHVAQRSQSYSLLG